MFVFQNFELGELKIPGLTLKPYIIEYIVSKVGDLTLTAAESQGQLFLAFDYSTELFKKETIERFIAYFKKIVTAIITDQSKKISDIKIISEKEAVETLNAIKSTEFNF